MEILNLNIHFVLVVASSERPLLFVVRTLMNQLPQCFVYLHVLYLFARKLSRPFPFYVQRQGSVPYARVTLITFELVDRFLSKLGMNTAISEALQFFSLK